MLPIECSEKRSRQACTITSYNENKRGTHTTDRVRVSCVGFWQLDEYLKKKNNVFVITKKKKKHAK